jgi:hypothetical protein
MQLGSITSAAAARVRLVRVCVCVAEGSGPAARAVVTWVHHQLNLAVQWSFQRFVDWELCRAKVDCNASVAHVSYACCGQLTAAC